MPTTVNGIGTHYYGKQNLLKRPGACPHCGRQVELSSYDTRLWVVVVFIPIIPLGRKRIIDACPACTRHYAVDAETWETTKQLEVSGALDTYRSSPTPDNAIAAHQQLLKFHQWEQAASFRQELAQRFADNAQVQTHLGLALVHLGQPQQAAPYFARALALRPDLPEARIGVAQDHLRAGRLDQARRLLDFLEKPGAAQLYSLQPLELLAIACQNAGRHAEALELYQAIVRELPAVASVPAFRKAIKKSEKALARRESILPKTKFSWRSILASRSSAANPRSAGWRGLFLLGGIVALIVLCLMLVANEWIRRHRTVHIVSSLTQRATVEIRGATTVTVKPGVTNVVLPEGRYHVVVSGPLREEFDCEIRSDYWGRWFEEPAWVLDVGRSSILVLRKVVYRPSPPPAVETFHFGLPLHRFHEVTHPFQELPATIRLESGNERTLWQLERFTGDTVALFYYLAESQLPEALRLAEWRLRQQPADESMLIAYTAAAVTQNQTPRAEALLREGLKRRPVEIGWHRAYQNLGLDVARQKQLCSDYDAMLQAEPTNASLMYLRGRITLESAESRRWFERARAADPQNPYPLFAVAFDLVSAGDWAGARPLLARAVELLPAQPQFQSLFFETRLALGEFTALETEYRQQVVARPFKLQSIVRLGDALLAQGRKADAEQAIQAFEAEVRKQSPESVAQVRHILRRYLLYRSGEFAALEKEALADNTPGGRASLFAALVEQGKPAEAAKIQLPQRNGSTQLWLAVAWGLAGQQTQAAQCRARAAQEFAAGTDDGQRVAAILTKPEPPSRQELDEINLPANTKALVLTALAQAHPGQGAELAAAARRLNVDRDFPYHLIQRATAAAP